MHRRKGRLRAIVRVTTGAEAEFRAWDAVNASKRYEIVDNLFYWRYLRNIGEVGQTFLGCDQKVIDCLLRTKDLWFGWEEPFVLERLADFLKGCGLLLFKPIPWHNQCKCDSVSWVRHATSRVPQAVWIVPESSRMVFLEKLQVFIKYCSTCKRIE